jgi:hypothetical protein
MTGYVTAEVLDQTGQPMTFGTYYITFSITGKGYLEGGTETIVVGTIDQQAIVAVSSWAGEPSTIRINASATSLGSRSVSIPTYIAGVPKSIRVTATDTSGEAGGAGDMRITVGLYDSNGRPAITASPITVEFVLPAESGLSGLDDILFNTGDSYHPVFFQGTTTGTYTVSVRDADTGSPAVSSTSFSCTVVSGEVGALSITPDGDPVTFILVSYPRATLTAQLKDILGNNVAKSGVRLQFSATVSGTGTVTWSTSQGKVNTDSTGKATITMIGQGYVGNAYTVTVRADLDNDGSYDDLESLMAADGIVIADRIPASFTMTFRNALDQVITYIQADADQTATATIGVLDKNQVAIASGVYDIELVFSNLGRYVLEGSVTLPKGSALEEVGDGFWRLKTDVDAVAKISFQGGLAGLYNITAKCLNVIPVASKAFSFRTTQGSVVVEPLVLKTDNTPATAVTYVTDRAVQLRVGLVDNGGNPIPAPAPTTLYLTPSGGGEYRLSSTGIEVTEVDLGTGISYKTVYYVNGGPGGTLDLSHDVSLTP